MPFDRVLETAVPSLLSLSPDVVLAVWDVAGEAPARLVPHLDGLAARPPYMTFALPAADGTRVMVAFRWPGHAQATATLSFSDSQGDAVARAQAAPMAPAAAPLLDGIEAGQQVRLAHILLNTVRAGFGLGASAPFVALCRDLFQRLAPQPAPLRLRCHLAAGHGLAEGAWPLGFGPVRSVVMLGRETVTANRFLPAALPAPASRSRAGFALALAQPQSGEAVVAMLSETSLFCSTIRAEAAPSLLEWLEAGKVAPAAREQAAAALAELGRTDERAAALLGEMQLLNPLPPRAVTAGGKPVGAGIELAVADSAGGLFVAGWLHDPQGLVAGLEAVAPTGRRFAMGLPSHRFPRPEIARHYGASRSEGFAAYLSGAAHDASLQWRFALTLRSGAVIDLVAPQAPLDATEARNAVLGAVPPQHMTPEMLRQVVAPAAAALHARVLASEGTPRVLELGAMPTAPAVSVVIPLYRNLDFLRFQIGAFAVDPALRAAELVFVLDSPEQAAEVEHMLRGLHALYELPVRLVVMARNMGFSSACNAGARASVAPLVLFLNSDVVPVRPGWLAPLVAALDDPAVGAAGPKLLFDDDSLQHAGMSFALDLRGDWYNMHFHKGLPRAYAPACRARSVPAVTGAALLIRRAILDQIGGFCRDYIIGDYEDSDLCLAVRAAGHDIRYVPETELYHLERQSISKHAGYTRGVACAYNRDLHQSRWAEAMAELVARDWSPAEPRKVKVAA